VPDGAKKIDVKFRAIDFSNGDVYIGSVCVATRKSRDWDPIINDDFYVIGGKGFYERGGSAKYPCADPYEDTIMRGKLPVSIYDKLDDEDKAKLTIIDDSKREALLDEKERLVARLAEIEEELKNA
jgi:hypothetical protein